MRSVRPSNRAVIYKSRLFKNYLDLVKAEDETDEWIRAKRAQGFTKKISRRTIEETDPFGNKYERYEVILDLEL